MKESKEITAISTTSKDNLKTYGEKPISFEFDNNERFYIGSEVSFYYLNNSLKLID